MRISPESGNIERPEVSLIEKDSHVKAGKFPGHEEKVSHLDLPIDPTSIKKSEYDEMLTTARESILNNQTLLKKLLLAITKKSEGGVVKIFAEIENTLIEECINLTDADIDNIIRQLNSKFLDYINKNQGSLEISGKTLQETVTGRKNLDSKGVKSVVGFVRERSKLLLSKPSQRFEIGSNSRFDANRKIDLIEVIFGEKDDIEQLNLIQVKSSMPTEEEMREITKEHTDFDNRDLAKVEEIENLQHPEEKKEQLFRETLSNQTIMFERIFEICLDYKGMDQNALIETLGLSNLNPIQRAWVMDTYLEIIKEQVEGACSEGFIAEQNRDELIRDLESLHKNLISKSGVPKNITRIKSVNSIIAVGPKIVRQTKVYDSEKGGGLAATT